MIDLDFVGNAVVNYTPMYGGCFNILEQLESIPLQPGVGLIANFKW